MRAPTTIVSSTEGSINCALFYCHSPVGQQLASVLGILQLLKDASTQPKVLPGIEHTALALAVQVNGTDQLPSVTDGHANTAEQQTNANGKFISIQPPARVCLKVVTREALSFTNTFSSYIPNEQVSVYTQRRVLTPHGEQN